jgi:IS5 family transposase
MSHRVIGQEGLGLVKASRGGATLDLLSALVDWQPIAAGLAPLYPSARGEPAWPPLAMFKALLLAVWHDLSHVKLAEALDDRASFRRFCGFSADEATPERSAFVRFRRALIAHGLDRRLFEAVTSQLKARAVTVKTGTLVDATIIASASKDDGEASPVPPPRSTSPPPPTTSNGASTSSQPESPRLPDPHPSTACRRRAATGETG